MTENVVDDDDDEPSVPPPIFLSYQWAHQPEVKLLKRHLGMAGYSSWMDIGQMGGGDKLFAKIDAGIRAAKVIVCCVTQRYSESPNCNREVNLSVTLGKPIIPLLMENLPWPPSGAMGPIFGEYIFVRFFQRDGETTDDDRYWSSDKFNELLMQIRYNIAPDVALITKDSPYQNWWTPPKEIVIIKKKIQPDKSLTPVETVERTGNKIESQSPEIFISYQWDKQPQIKALYRRLTELGYTCWLDIMQMGGGDSLYDKIDRGVRGCKLVLSCVTSKYALSANCRREVSLADAIKRPIIPLLLEKITWPPEGPMAMVLTQLLYIDFCHPNDEVQKHWDGSRFDELLKKIDGYLKTDITVNRQPEQGTRSVGLWDVKNTNTNPILITGQTVETAKRTAGASSKTRPNNRPGNTRISAKLNSGSKMTYPPTKTANPPIKQGSKMANSTGAKSNNSSVVSPASSNLSFIAVNSLTKTVDNSTKTTPASLKSNNFSVKPANISIETTNLAAETTHPTPVKVNKSSSVTTNPMSSRLIQSTWTAKSSADKKKLSSSTKSATPPIKPPDHSTNNAHTSDCPGVSPYPTSGTSTPSVETAKITELN